jgi:multidrug resistance efflux pump
MSPQPSADYDSVDSSALLLIQELRNFSGSQKEFWPAYLSNTGKLIQARAAILTHQNAHGNWQQFGSWKNRNYSSLKDDIITSSFEKWLEDNTAPDYPLYQSLSHDNEYDAINLFISPVKTKADGEKIFAIYLTDEHEEVHASAKIDLLALISDVPASYQSNLTLIQAKSDIDSFATAADLLVLLNRQTRFLAANMTLCNELASRFSCDRVSIGWLKESYVRVLAISHMEKFEKKMDAVQELEASMEEALEQNTEILCPPASEVHYIARDHKIYQSAQKIENLYSLPLRDKDEALAVLTFERNEVFAEREMLRLRLIADQLTQRLIDLKNWDRWFGARIYSNFKKKVNSWLSVEFTLIKGMCILGIILCLWLVFGKLTYRVKAPFILRSKNVRYIPAPNNGYIRTVNIEKGDIIPEGSLLLNLDNRELLLEESAALADQVRFEREIVKARAENRLVEMRIAEAQKDQATVSLEKIRYYLAQASILSPFDGVVVEGDLKEKIGVPVQQGDLLYKIAQLDNMYSELKISEDDIHEVESGSSGHLAFTSQPNIKFPIIVDRIEPLAQSLEEGNVFIVRCHSNGPVEKWWRPGMSGIAKIEVGKRSPLFILSHKTIDYLRLRFW